MSKRRENRRPERRFGAKDFLGILLGLFLFFGVPNLFMRLLSPEEPGEYGIYSGPVLPLSSISGGEGVEVSRTVTLDFSVYGEEKEYLYAPERVAVTDSYTLTNPSEETASVELVWGFDSDFSGNSPVITVDGVPVAGTILSGRAADMTGPKIRDFQMYSEALTETDLLAEAMVEAPVWEVPVKVYHFYDLQYEGEEVLPPMLGVSWKDAADTTVWVRQHGVCGTDKGRCFLNFDIGEDVWLYVMGEDLEDLKVIGTKNNTQGRYSETEVEGLTWDLETYESTFMDCLWEAAQAYVDAAVLEEEYGSAVSLVTEQMLCDSALKQIVGCKSQGPGGFHSLNSYFYGQYNDRRMIYWVFPVEIPPGAGVTVSGTYVKQSSYNVNGERHGYDIATTLGSNLHFIEQEAVLVNTDAVILTELVGGQNFGFDPEAGVTEVTLDPGVDRYFLDLLPNKNEG